MNVVDIILSPETDCDYIAIYVNHELCITKNQLTDPSKWVGLMTKIKKIDKMAEHQLAFESYNGFKCGEQMPKNFKDVYPYHVYNTRAL